MARLWASCCRQERGPGRHGDPAHANTHAGRDLTLDAPMMPSPSTVFRFHQQPPLPSSASAKVHIGPSSEKSVAVELHQTASPVSASFPEVVGIEAQAQGLDQDHERHDTHCFCGASARLSLLRPTETTDQKPGANPHRTSIKEHWVALSVSGKGLVDRLSTSGKTPAAEHLRSTLARVGQNEVESQQSLLAVLASDREEESQLDANHTAPIHNPLLPPVAHLAASPFVHSDISRLQEQKGRRS